MGPLRGIPSLMPVLPTPPLLSVDAIWIRRPHASRAANRHSRRALAHMQGQQTKGKLCVKLYLRQG